MTVFTNQNRACRSIRHFGPCIANSTRVGPLSCAGMPNEYFHTYPYRVSFFFFLKTIEERFKALEWFLLILTIQQNAIVPKVVGAGKPIKSPSERALLLSVAGWHPLFVPTELQKSFWFTMLQLYGPEVWCFFTCCCFHSELVFPNINSMCEERSFMPSSRTLT